MTSSILVEFCGLPGAGKSTLAAAVHAGVAGGRDGAAGIRAGVPAWRRLPRKLALLSEAVVSDPVGMARLAARVGTGPRTGPTDAANRVVQWAGAQRLIAKARAAGGLHLFDEGVVQALWSIGLRSDVAPVLELLAEAPNRWARPDLLVVVDEPMDVALSRLRERPSRHSRTQRLRGPEQAAELRVGRELFDRLVQWTCGLPGAPVVLRVVPSRQPQASKLVTERLAELVRAVPTVRL